MNKKLILSKNALTLFIFNIVVLITMIFFRIIFLKIGYINVLVNIMFILNVILLILGIISNIIFIKDEKKYNDNKYMLIIMVVFIIYILLNTVGIYIFNKPFQSKYKKFSNQIKNYCNAYRCDKYYTKKQGGYEIFVIENKYFDYNGVENDIIIENKYNTDKIVMVTAKIESQKNSFSEFLITEKIEDYFKNFGYEVSMDKIRAAFNKRFEGSVDHYNANYKVNEIYEKGELKTLETIIKLDLK